MKIDHPAAEINNNEDDSSSSSTVTVEVDVASEADGYAVLTYILSVVEGSSSEGDGQGLATALNEALEGRTTDGCLCVAVPVTGGDGVGGGGGYDCSACEEGGAFSTDLSITTLQGGYNLLSTESSPGWSPVSVFDSADSRGDDDMFWNDLAGGKVIRGVIRSDTYVNMMSVVAAIVFFTSLGLFCLRRCPGEEGIGRRLSSTIGGGKLLATDTQNVADWKQHQERSKTSEEYKRNHHSSPGVFTPEATPAP